MKPNVLLYLEDQITRNELVGQESEWVRRTLPEWFSIEPLSGVEYMQAQQMKSNVSHRLKSIFLPNCNSRMRLTAGADKDNLTRVFNVESVVNVGELNRELEWMCKEVV